MIVNQNPSWIGALVTLKGSIIKRIALRCLMITLLACLIVLIERRYPAWFAPVSATPFTLLGLSLSIFMSFRNTACHDRWWEGRRAWGNVLIETRSFIRASVALENTATRASLLRELCGFSHALNARLRGEDEYAAARAWLPETRAAYGINVSDAILRRVGNQCAKLASDSAINEWRYTILEQRLHTLATAQGTCERIKQTPLPFPYTLLLHRTIFLFCILLPFAMAQPLGWITPVFTAIVSYTFFGLDAIAEELEDPFGYDENDLPTSAIARTIEREILDALGETELPPAPQSRSRVLT
ncbi:bestrophin family protein [Salinicola rhizosphaerae]|uniref:Membrane protein n=1 Tax=Salinicola rhizosphaerae TaxID=1443141 RepID=A0ABQ3DRM1_9GAMM|nr:bestrophin family protein [Salinicola rhizosphaerae]GHB13208.1 membrane protein [Salinicola rhizosphaerae]